MNKSSASVQLLSIWGWFQQPDTFWLMSMTLQKCFPMSLGFEPMTPRKIILVTKWKSFADKMEKFCWQNDKILVTKRQSFGDKNFASKFWQQNQPKEILTKIESWWQKYYKYHNIDRYRSSSWWYLINTWVKICLYLWDFCHQLSRLILTTTSFVLQERGKLEYWGIQ